MTDGEALLRAIREHPNDSTPRLIYADLLQDDGDDARAAFIRCQVELARTPEFKFRKGTILARRNIALDEVSPRDFRAVSIKCVEPEYGDLEVYQAHDPGSIAWGVCENDVPNSAHAALRNQLLSDPDNLAAMVPAAWPPLLSFGVEDLQPLVPNAFNMASDMHGRVPMPSVPPRWPAQLNQVVRPGEAVRISFAEMAADKVPVMTELSAMGMGMTPVEVIEIRIGHPDGAAILCNTMNSQASYRFVPAMDEQLMLSDYDISVTRPVRIIMRFDERMSPELIEQLLAQGREMEAARLALAGVPDDDFDEPDESSDLEGSDLEGLEDMLSSPSYD